MLKDNFPRINVSVSMVPTSAFPLDGRTMFDNMNDLRQAALSAVEVGETDSNYYFGQLLTYKSPDSKEVYVYKIVDYPQRDNILNLVSLTKEEYRNIVVNVLDSPEIKQIQSDVTTLQSPKPNSGLAYTEDGLKVNFSNNSGLKTNDEGLALKLGVKSGLQISDSGLRMKFDQNSGLKLTNNGVSIKTATNSGLLTTSDGLKVNFDGVGGLDVKNNSLCIKFQTNSGLQVSEEGIGIKTDNSGNVKFQTTEDGVKGNCCWTEYE